LSGPSPTGDEPRDEPDDQPDDEVEDEGVAAPSGSAATTAAAGPAPSATGSHGKPRRVRALLVGTAIAAVLAVVLFVGLGTRSGSSGGVASVGSTAPSFTIPSLLGGAPVDLDALGPNRGRPVVLNFFASWCIPCRQETPLLARTAKTEKARGGKAQFVGVDVADPKADAVAFVHQAGITYPVGTDSDLNVAQSLYGLTGEPSTFFIDSSGKIVGHVIGPVTAPELTNWLHRLNAPAA
jgi:cytochrome c biogenesis protein CcmG, thiol:disulfide interchange protein DsbE